MGKALIFSAPSGSGKTTIVRHLMEVFDELDFSISATTRAIRGQEVDGKDYHFLTVDEFKNREFVESEEVYPGVYYGTLKEEVERVWAEGKTVIFDVDVKGGVNLKEYFGDQSLAVFVKAPSLEEIKKRLASRATESEENLQTRFSRMEYELTFEDHFDVTLVNDVLETTLQEAEGLVSAFLNR